MSIRALCLMLALAVPAPAAADVPEELLSARRELASYDRSGGTLRTVRALHELAGRTLPGANQREARFLRAVAATDLLLIARSRRDPSIHAEVARTLGLLPEALHSALERELAELEVGAYAEVARECRWSLGVLARGADPAVLRDGTGTRRDVLYVSAVVDALGQPDEIARVARLGREVDAGEPAAFTAEGMRAIAALREANDALARLEHVEGADPFAAALAAIVAVDGAVLRTAELRPPVALPRELGARASGGDLSRAELIVIVRSRAIEYAYAPSVRVRGGGVELVHRGEPALPSFASIPLADDGRAAVAPYESLVPRLAALRAPLGEGARVGITAEDEVAALTVSRVILTMTRAELGLPDLIARGEAGEARSIPIELVTGEDVDADLALFVRLGGYTLRRGPRSLDIPRVRDASGLRFDTDTLERSARAAHASTAALRYMGVVGWGTVLEAAFRLESSEPLALVLY